MRVAVVYYSNADSPLLKNMASALARGMERQGQDVTVVNAKTDSGKSLTAYEYIAVGTCPPSYFTAKIPDGLASFLKNAGMISGKRSYAFVCGKGLRKMRFLASLMKVMESEGMFLKSSSVIAKVQEAEAIGAHLHIDKVKV